jgi:TatD DNase family protein
MATFFDTHCHLESPRFDPDRADVISRARAAGVSMLTLGTDPDSSAAALRIARAHEGVRAAVGLFPYYAGRETAEDLARLEAWTGEPEVAAVGEIGLDYVNATADADAQRTLLEPQLELALAKNLAVSLHARKSEADLLDAAAPYVARGLRAVWHCFVSGKKSILRHRDRAAEMGLWFGISGMVTWTNEMKPLREAVGGIPEEKLLLDTDSPYLLPRPKTLDRNEPAQCVRIAGALAELRGRSLEEMAALTTRNARALLGLAPPDAGEETPPADAPTLAYALEGRLYLNVTDRCNADCVFCHRRSDPVVRGHDLSMPGEPPAEALVRAAGDVSPYEEVVFCGFGEPTLRLDTVTAVARALRPRARRLRLNTNGLGSLHHGRDVAAELAPLLDAVSISLNTADPAQYKSLCRPEGGEAAFPAVCAFVRASVRAGLETTCTAVDLPEVDAEAARALARRLGASFRLRGRVPRDTASSEESPPCPPRS